MADKLAKLFEKNDKKKQAKSKSGLSTFTDPLSEETSFDMHAVKVSLCSAGLEKSEAVEHAPLNFSRADSRCTEWSNAKSPLFTENENGKTKNIKLCASGRKKLGVDNISWSQLPSVSEETLSMNVTDEGVTGSRIVDDKDCRLLEEKEPKKFVARGRVDSTGCARKMTSSIPGSDVIESEKAGKTQENRLEPDTNGRKTFIARGKSGSTGTIGSSSVACPVPSSAIGGKTVIQSSSQATAQPNRYVPPSRR